eukprot:1487021-Pyramimonas_sp.AAC.2
MANVHTIAPTINTIAPTIHNTAPNIHIIAPNIHTTATVKRSGENRVYRTVLRCAALYGGVPYFVEPDCTVLYRFEGSPVEGIPFEGNLAA